MPDPAPPKQQIPGYQLLAKLGSGGMSSVYKARQLSLDRVVAIKVLPRHYSANLEFIQRLQAEGRAAAKLNHPNIVGALDVGKAGEVNYFVMEYVEGVTVFDELMEDARIDQEEAVRIILGIARGLEAAHKVGIIHRDVKPQNMMLTPDSVAKLADMGLARAPGIPGMEMDEAGKTYGSPYYVSPEQIRSQPDIDFRADIYSLGASFYYMVTGRPPYDARTPEEVMKLHLAGKLTPPEEIDPGILPGVSRIIRVCMAANRDDRYASTSDLVQDLESVSMGDLPLHATAKLGLTGHDEHNPAPPAPAPRAKIRRPTRPVARKPITSERFFWPAVVGWALVVILLLVILISRLTR